MPLIRKRVQGLARSFAGRMLPIAGAAGVIVALLPPLVTQSSSVPVALVRASAVPLAMGVSAAPSSNETV